MNFVENGTGNVSYKILLIFVGHGRKPSCLSSGGLRRHLPCGIQSCHLALLRFTRAGRCKLAKRWRHSRYESWWDPPFINSNARWKAIYIVLLGRCRKSNCGTCINFFIPFKPFESCWRICIGGLFQQLGTCKTSGTRMCWERHGHGPGVARHWMEPGLVDARCDWTHSEILVAETLVRRKCWFQRNLLNF